jgi:hypothetical protein
MKVREMSKLSYAAKAVLHSVWSANRSSLRLLKKKAVILIAQIGERYRHCSGPWTTNCSQHT